MTDPFPFGTSPNIGEELKVSSFWFQVSGFMNLFCQRDRTDLDRCHNPYHPCHRVDGTTNQRDWAGLRQKANPCVCRGALRKSHC